MKYIKIYIGVLFLGIITTTSHAHHGYSAPYGYGYQNAGNWTPGYSSGTFSSRNAPLSYGYSATNNLYPSTNKFLNQYHKPITTVEVQRSIEIANYDIPHNEYLYAYKPAFYNGYQQSYPGLSQSYQKSSVTPYASYQQARVPNVANDQRQFPVSYQRYQQPNVAPFQASTLSSFSDPDQRYPQFTTFPQASSLSAFSNPNQRFQQTSTAPFQARSSNPFEASLEQVAPALAAASFQTAAARATGDSGTKTFVCTVVCTVMITENSAALPGRVNQPNNNFTPSVGASSVDI